MVGWRACGGVFVLFCPLQHKFNFKNITIQTTMGAILKNTQWSFSPFVHYFSICPSFALILHHGSQLKFFPDPLGLILLPWMVMLLTWMRRGLNPSLVAKWKKTLNNEIDHCKWNLNGYKDTEILASGISKHLIVSFNYRLSTHLFFINSFGN